MVRHVQSYEQVRDHFDVSEYRVRQWKHQGCLGLQHSPFCIDAIERWLETGAGDVGVPNPGNDDERQSLISEIAALVENGKWVGKKPEYWLAAMASGISVSEEVREWIDRQEADSVVSKPHILMVDDDLIPYAPERTGGYMWYYARAFRDNGYAVTEVDGVDAALDVVENARQRFSLAVLDIMMAPEQAFTDNTSRDVVRGLRSGILLTDRFNELVPDMPVVVLSVRNPATMGELDGKPNVKRVITKKQCPPFQFVEEVKGILEKK